MNNRCGCGESLLLQMKQSGLMPVLLVATLFFAGCSNPPSTGASQGNFPAAATAATYPQPSRVLVADFSATPGIVQLDTSPGVQLQRSASGISAQQAQAQDVAEVQNVLADTLVQKILAMGLAAERVPPGTQPGAGELLVTGQIASIAEGSRVRRTVVGLGAGKSSVQGSAELLLGTSAGPQMLQTFDLSANSGRMPGLGIGAAATGVKSVGTAISGAAHAYGETKRTPVGDRAARLANQLSAGLGKYFAARHWIPATVASD